jgi:hypothetical protein
MAKFDSSTCSLEFGFSTRTDDGIAPTRHNTLCQERPTHRRAVGRARARAWLHMPASPEGTKKTRPALNTSKASGSKPSTPSPSQRKGTPASTPKGGKGRKGGSAAAAPGKGGKKKERAVGADSDVLLPSEDFRAKAKALRDESAGKAKDSVETLASRLGDAVDKMAGEKNIKPQELFRQWDKNGDAHITKMEFRQAVRELKLTGNSNEAPAVDALFNALDLDDSADISVAELAAGMKRLKLEAAESVKAREGLQATVDRLETRAAQCEAAAEATSACEEVKKQMDAMVANPTVEHRVTVAMFKTNIKATELLTRWDVNLDGNGACACACVRVCVCVHA